MFSYSVQVEGQSLVLTKSSLKAEQTPTRTIIKRPLMSVDVNLAMAITFFLSSTLELR